MDKIGQPVIILLALDRCNLQRMKLISYFVMVFFSCLDLISSYLFTCIYLMNFSEVSHNVAACVSLVMVHGFGSEL